ncbi:MAG: hypothetical protein Q9160_002488 [Pyrenula sp. 1 TL-2023]
MNKPSTASPHRLILIADPQLVDPHTYPGRSWPLSSLTIGYTDLYLKRSYHNLQKTLKPDSVVFLGDLFDGGREWSTKASKSPEPRYRKYGDTYWMREYKRFSRIFFYPFGDGNSYQSSSAASSRKLIASLPGNHDLGFASGIQLPVKKRFEAYFGPSNRIDIIGNHTIVSVDTVSLSAMGQADPVTGSSGAGDGTSSSLPPLSHIWAPTEDFLGTVKDARAQSIARELRRLLTRPDASHYTGETDVNHKFQPILEELSSTLPTNRLLSEIPSVSSSRFPTIILSHVPFYRPPDSNCGPLREGGPSISISAGYQYQNALTTSVSADIIEKAGPAEEIVHIYSGDDHDFCEWTHTEFTGGIKETTVKSISAAMGVRKPGFLSVSLWNPIDFDTDQPISAKDTIQEHLCLLPDMLHIFTNYAYLLVFTIIIIFIATISSRRRKPSTGSETPILPLANIYTNGQLSKRAESPQPASTKSSSLPQSDQNLSSRTNNRPSRYHGRPPPLGGYGNVPTPSRSSSPSKSKYHHQAMDDDNDHDHEKPSAIAYVANNAKGSSRRLSKRESLLMEFGRNMRNVALPVLAWYFWLLWHG